MSERDDGYPRGQRKVGQVNDLAHVELRHVHLQVLRQILRQTADLHLGHGVRNHAATEPDALALVLVDEVQRYVHLNGSIRAHPQEIHVHYLVIGRIALHVAKHGLLDLAFQLDVENVREERFVLHRLAKLVGTDHQILGRSIRAVDDPRDLFAGTAQAAARTFPYVHAQLCVDFEFLGHVISSVPSNGPDTCDQHQAFLRSGPYLIGTSR